ncbi:DEAH-box RNA helicase prp16 [Geranomyces variabilis]|uniref:DEAH-box RNA helicase prp16 n=1 Tax=Geranomyces variabilis TaxID=109894 RepID=A0AAD5TQ76_9FUNG|nr:DEAH-box RNA helicase prp16 [Geranomyces variabilis]
MPSLIKRFAAYWQSTKPTAWAINGVGGWDSYVVRANRDLAGDSRAVHRHLGDDLALLQDHLVAASHKATAKKDGPRAQSGFKVSGPEMEDFMIHSQLALYRILKRITQTNFSGKKPTASQTAAVEVDLANYSESSVRVASALSQDNALTNDGEDDEEDDDDNENDDEPTANYVEAAVDKVREIHASGAPGDILVFMPGEKDVHATVKALSDTAGLESLPLYSQLPQEAQERSLRAGGAVLRRVIVATNIAEASVTIRGLGFVIDSGFSKVTVFNPRERINTLFQGPKSHAELKAAPTPELMDLSLSSDGEKAIRLSIEPALAKTLLAAGAARISINTSHSDHLTLLRVFNDYIRLPSATAQRQWCQEKFVKQRVLSEAVKVRQQLAAQARALDIMNSETAVVQVEKIRKAFAIGHATRVARRSGSIGLRYVTKEGTTATISKNRPETPLTRETCLGYAALCDLGWQEGLGLGSFNHGETVLTTPVYRSSSDKSGIGYDEFAVDATSAFDNTAALEVSGLMLDPPKAATSEVPGLQAVTLEVLGLQAPLPPVVPAPHTSAPVATASPASAPLATTAVATTPVATTTVAPVAPPVASIADLTPAQYRPLQVRLREEFLRVLDKVDDADRLLINLDEECERVFRGLCADRQVLATRDRLETLPPPLLESDSVQPAPGSLRRNVAP